MGERYRIWGLGSDSHITPIRAGGCRAAIFSRFAEGEDLDLSPEAAEKTRRSMAQIYAQRGASFANGRDVRNLFDRSKERLAIRAMAVARDERTSALLSTIEADDIEAAA